MRLTSRRPGMPKGLPRLRRLEPLAIPRRGPRGAAVRSARARRRADFRGHREEVLRVAPGSEAPDHVDRDANQVLRSRAALEVLAFVAVVDQERIRVHLGLRHVCDCTAVHGTVHLPALDESVETRYVSPSTTEALPLRTTTSSPTR